MKKIILLLIGVTLSAQLHAQNVDYREKAKTLVAKMTLEEKASLCSGETAWSTKPIARLGIPSIFMTDGPHGLRKAEGFDFTNSVPATCFPTASAVASSWNPALAQKMGEALAIESQANDVQILLGPGVNMKRSPLGGRNFEYFSEDPILAGTIATGYINGVQSQGVGTSIKHFAANNQETERMSNNSNVDERTLNEIYFPAFEMAVKNAQPWTVMCSYNKLNGVYASENPYLLNETLKKKWDFKGFVVSDWGAVNERATGVDAGLSLEMPASGGFNDKKIVDAVKKGTLSEARLDEIVTDVVAITLKAKDSHKKRIVVDKVKHNDLARQVSSECIVLLKNDNAILPLKSTLKKIAIVGNFAKTPRYQGAGSSQVRPTQIVNALDELQKMVKGTQFSFSTGYNTEGETDDTKITEAVQNAKNAELVIVFAGLPDSYESEGYDRKNLDMPAGHNQLISAVAAVNKNIVIVLMNGAPVSMPWKKDVSAIVEAYLGGQAGGGAIADVLTGKVNPSGKLSETFPMRLEDTPTAMDFPSKDGNANYGEGIFIGYRYYDKKKIEPNFPFGYGLSYTTFAYSDIKTNSTSAKDTDDITISLKVKNTGKVAGKEVVELYVHEQETEVSRPENELKHFEKVTLLPGEEKTVTFNLTSRDFAYFNSKSHDWAVKSGKFDIRVGGSSRDLPLQQTIDIQSTKTVKVVFTRESLFKEFKNVPNSTEIYAKIIQSFTGENKKPETEDEKKAAKFLEAMLADMPLNKFLLLSGGKLTEENLDVILKDANKN
ncbi:glycoside hydrolase family 3 C-terminal domain-containing protein [Flavobacterium sp.]|uniref:glycoside hydrolase family 3 C-terminal domain-containing protein n=1 Tax=Flavobacterium sp. TaxID=239 RepID=UPI001B64E49A|nr:glycoside hydrolase family 3 C-terminal domain-containing protein [Flavobacterium sp.]MBP6182307.1 glycoside hydrolase family 3 C-terminal domain-containing protein [Flavobacterium sp.]